MSQPVRPANVPGRPDDAGSLEASLVALARSGRLSRSTRAAIRRQLSQGLPVTFKRGTRIIKKYPDGHEEVLRIIPRPKYRLPAGVPVIGRE